MRIVAAFALHFNYSSASQLLHSMQSYHALLSEKKGGTKEEEEAAINANQMHLIFSVSATVTHFNFNDQTFCNRYY